MKSILLLFILLPIFIFTYLAGAYYSDKNALNFFKRDVYHSWGEFSDTGYGYVMSVPCNFFVEEEYINDYPGKIVELFPFPQKNPEFTNTRAPIRIHFKSGNLESATNTLTTGDSGYWSKIKELKEITIPGVSDHALQGILQYGSPKGTVEDRIVFLIPLENQLIMVLESERSFENTVEEMASRIRIIKPDISEAQLVSADIRYTHQLLGFPNSAIFHASLTGCQ